MIANQDELDRNLDRCHTVTVEISDQGELPPSNQAYDALRNLPQSGFTFKLRELLHAIGCKTAALPTRSEDECIRSAHLFTNILDLESDHLSFKGGYGSDLQSARSQEIGIGMMCLLVKHYFNIPWDQLESLPGRGRRFDYRGRTGDLECIFEAKGTSNYGYQSVQIRNGLEKKDAYHSRGENFNVELIVSAYIGCNGRSPRIIIADPIKDSLKNLYYKGDNRYYRLRHYCRVLQFVGLPWSAYRLYKYARDYIAGKESIFETILREKKDRGFLKEIEIAGDKFLGRWFDSWLPEESSKYRKLKKYNTEKFIKNLKIFQGIRQDIYESGLAIEPFSEPLLSDHETKQYTKYHGSGVSVLSDGTIMIIRY